MWGNLQIDAPRTHPGKNKPELNILLRRKNLYSMMIQESVKHALATGAERIIFQAGAAAAWAQWRPKLPSIKR